MGYVAKRGVKWQGTYRGPDGKERTKTFAKRSDADRWVTTSESTLIKGGWIDPALGRMTFAEYVDYWERTLVDLRPTTKVLNVGVARNYLIPRFGDWPLGRITMSEVKAMLAEELMKEGRLSNSAIRRHVMVLSRIMAGAVEDGRIAVNPCRGVRLPDEASRKMRFLEAEQVAMLADAIDPHYRPLILTAAYAGLRWGELAGLKVANVNLLKRNVRVEEQLIEANGKLSFGPPKTDHGIRTVSIPPALAEILGPHFGTAPVRSSGLAFPGPRGALMRRPNFQRKWTAALDAAAAELDAIDGDGDVFRGLVFHELRHTAAALAIAQGAHPMAIKERLGHSSITTTLDRYGGLFPRLDEAIAEGLDGVLRSSFGSTEVAPAAAAVVPIQRG